MRAQTDILLVEFDSCYLHRHHKKATSTVVLKDHQNKRHELGEIKQSPRQVSDE